MARRLGIVLAASLLLLATSCGNDGGSAKDGTTTDEETTTTTEGETTTASEPDDGAAEGGDNPAYCAAVDDLDELVAILDEGDFQGFASAVAGGDAVIQRYVDLTPADLKDEAQLEMRAFEAWAERVGAVGADDPDAATKIDAAYAEAFTAEAQAASDATTEYLDETCPED